MSKLAFILGVTTSLCGCIVGDTGSGNSDENIIGGTPDSGDPSVVAVIYNEFGGGESLCTATVIAPKLLLTAAHCADGYNYQYHDGASVNFSSTAGWISATGAFKDPSYTGTSADGHDVAVIVLTSATTLSPVALGPVPAVGATVRAVGYGYTPAVASGGSAGNKEQKSFGVASVAAHEFVAGPNDTCHGDSGGPVFDTSGRIAGTTSYGDTASCNGNDHFMRVDDNLAWINSMISTFGGGSGSGSGSGSGGGSSSTCSTQVSSNGLTHGVSCTNGSCKCSINGAVTKTCTANASGCSIPGNCCGY